MERYRITFYYTDNSVREYEGITRESADGRRSYKAHKSRWWIPEIVLLRHANNLQSHENRNAGKRICLHWDMDIWDSDDNDFEQLLQRMVPVHPREVMTHG